MAERAVRRTSACQVELPLGRLAIGIIPCRRCGRRGVTVVQIGWNANGAVERAWCSPDCAELDGWPWLEVEKRGAVA